jgi:chromosome segregation ATPase
MRDAVAIGALLWVVATAAAAQSSAPPDGTMQALVSELRALRADLNRIAGANIRSNLLVGRLQLQEQRTIALSRQLETVQQELAGIAQERSSLEDRLQEVEESTSMKQEEREQLQIALRQQLKQNQRREQQLRQQESSLSGVVADEQARWTDFSSRLDELERTLIPRR